MGKNLYFRSSEIICFNEHYSWLSVEYGDDNNCFEFSSEGDFIPRLIELRMHVAERKDYCVYLEHIENHEMAIMAKVVDNDRVEFILMDNRVNNWEKGAYDPSDCSILRENIPMAKMLKMLDDFFDAILASKYFPMCFPFNWRTITKNPIKQIEKPAAVALEDIQDPVEACTYGPEDEYRLDRAMTSWMESRMLTPEAEHDAEIYTRMLRERRFQNEKCWSERQWSRNWLDKDFLPCPVIHNKSSHNINMYLKFAGIVGFGNHVFLSMEYGDDNSRYVYAEAFDYTENFIEMRTRLVNGENYYIRCDAVEEGETLFMTRIVDRDTVDFIIVDKRPTDNIAENKGHYYPSECHILCERMPVKRLIKMLDEFFDAVLASEYVPMLFPFNDRTVEKLPFGRSHKDISLEEAQQRVKKQIGKVELDEALRHEMLNEIQGLMLTPAGKRDAEKYIEMLRQREEQGSFSTWPNREDEIFFDLYSASPEKYSAGTFIDEEYLVRLLACCFKQEEFGYLAQVLADDCKYIGTDGEIRAEGGRAVIDCFKEISEARYEDDLELHAYLAELVGYDEKLQFDMAKVEHKLGTKCVALCQFEDRKPDTFVFIKMNAAHEIEEIKSCREGYDFYLFRVAM